MVFGSCCEHLGGPNQTCRLNERGAKASVSVANFHQGSKHFVFLLHSLSISTAQTVGVQAAQMILDSICLFSNPTH